jgi:peptide-methionine (R)-S-oxide reductase
MKTDHLSRRAILGGGAAAMLFGVFGGTGGAKPTGRFPVTLTEAQWKQRLTPAQFATLRQEDTERPRSSPLNGEKRAGTYVCAGCARPVFSSATKFESGTGWPSFWKPLPGAIGTKIDGVLMFKRTEVHCSRCGGHLGHVFDDGPKPTGLRYCMNGVAMKFRPGRA